VPAKCDIVAEPASTVDRQNLPTLNFSPDSKAPMNWTLSILVWLAAFFSANTVFAQAASKDRLPENFQVLDVEQLKGLDASVERGLDWLVTQQKKDGSFASIDTGQPGVTALCVMAFLAQGKTPDDREYGPAISKAIDFICAQQKKNGLVSMVSPPTLPIPRPSVTQHEQITPAIYNHALGALALAEAYGQCTDKRSDKIADVVEKAIAATVEMQGWRKAKKDKGGWRYLCKPHPEDSDLSVTGWMVMFLRSARNAGFEVPAESIDQAVTYMEGCFHKKTGTFSYCAQYPNSTTRAMAGAGVLAMAHAGKHQSEMAMKASDYILQRDFTKFNHEPACRVSWLDDRYNYGAFLCTQAMYQQGGTYWAKFYPPVVTAILNAQDSDGSWPTEPRDREFGNCYTTALCVLTLSVPDQLLPIFQR